MSISFNTAANAYNSTASILSKNPVANDAESGSAASGAGGAGFARIINDAMSNTAASLHKAENIVAKSLVKQADITDVVTAVTNAEITLRTVVEVRDRLIAAHQEILRMPI